MRKKLGCERIDCVYRSENCGEMVTCDYLLITGEVRGCPIEECDKYKPRDKRKGWDNNDYWFKRK